MSDDVKARLAAAGWSDRTRGGHEIVQFMEDGCDGFVGVIQMEFLHAATWIHSGKNMDAELSPNDWDLVPLPAPVAVQDEQPWNLTDDRLERMARSGSTTDAIFLEWRSCARELVAARKRIAELEDERDELRQRLESTPVQKLAKSVQSITLFRHRRLVAEAVSAERNRCFSILQDMLDRMADIPISTRAQLAILDGMIAIEGTKPDQS